MTRIPDLQYLTIGNEAPGLLARTIDRCVEVIIPHHHQPLARHHLLLVAESAVADPLIVGLSLAIGPRDQHRLLLPHPAVGLLHQLRQVIA